MKQLCRYAESGIDRHPDRTEIYFRLQIQGNRKLILVSILFREVFSHLYISFLPRTRMREQGLCVRVCGVHISMCLWTKKIFESYFSDRLIFSNIRSRTCRQIYRGHGYTKVVLPPHMGRRTCSNYPKIPISCLVKRSHTHETNLRPWK